VAIMETKTEKKLKERNTSQMRKEAAQSVNEKKPARSSKMVSRIKILVEDQVPETKQTLLSYQADLSET